MQNHDSRGTSTHETGVLYGVFAAGQKLFPFITPWNSLRRWIFNSFPFFLVQQAGHEHLKTILPHRSMVETHDWRHMVTPHQSEPKSNPQSLISTCTTTITNLSPSLHPITNLHLHYQSATIDLSQDQSHNHQSSPTPPPIWAPLSLQPKSNPDQTHIGGEQWERERERKMEMIDPNTSTHHQRKRER